MLQLNSIFSFRLITFSRCPKQGQW